MPKEFKSHFTDYVVPMPELAGNWGGTKNGTDIPGGEKGTSGIMPEVTFVDLAGAPGPGDSAGAIKGDIGMDPVRGKAPMPVKG